MKPRKLLSFAAAAVMTITSLSGAFSAFAADTTDPSDIVLPDSGAWSKTSITNSAKLEFSPYSGNGNVVSALSGKNEFYATFDVTGVPEGGVRAYLPTVFIGGGSHWNADDVVSFVEIPTDGTYTVKFSGEAIPDPAKLQYCGINFKGLTNTTDVKVSSIELKYVTLSDPNAVPVEVVKSYDVSANGDGSVTATIYSDGTFRISGTGDTKDYGVDGNKALGPWYLDGSSSSVTKVVVDEGVTSIGSYLLSSLKNATTATIPSTVTRIGNGAFSQSGYKDIKISGTSNITNLEKYAFYNCQSLETVDNGFLSNVTEIPECCFYDCTSLKPISIPDNITRIGDGAFHGCTALDTVVFPENLTYIGDNSFTNCPFTTIKIPDAVTYIGKMAFTVVDATSKLESVEISDNSKLETIGDHAFQDTKITSINLPEGLKTIGEYAFSRCPITTLELPSTLTDIGRYAFMYCGKITGDVIVPAGITVLKDSVFSSCSNENLNLYIKGAITSVGKYSISYCGGKIYVYDQNTYDLINDSINNKTNYVQAEVILVKGEGPDYTALDAAIADGEAVDTTKYTEASVKTLTDAIAAAKAVKENADATQDDVDAAAKAITDAIAALEEVPVDDGLYAKIYFKGYTPAVDDQFVIAEGTANAAMAGATQVKVTFDMGAKAAFNQMTKLNITGSVAGTDVTATLTGSGWPANGVKGNEKTFALPAELAAGDEYTLRAWTGNWESCKTEDNYVFGIAKVEFLNASGEVLYTHTQVEGPAAEDPNKVVVNGTEEFINQNNKFYLTLHTSGSDSNLISDDEWTKIGALAPNYTKFTFEVEVAGTVASPFTLVPRLDTTYTSDFDYWYIKPDANRGGPFISKSSEVTYNNFQISEPGTYKLEVILADGTRTSELSSLVCIESLEYNTYTNNPDATVTFKSFTVEGVAAVTPEIDYTALDEAIAAAEAVDASAYTAASYAAVTTALGTAKTVRENADATQDDVDAAAKAITDAIAALEEIPVEVVKTYDVSANGDGSVTATIYSDGTFRISGTGDTKDYGVDGNKALGPWYLDGSSSSVTKVVVDEGVTSIGSYLLSSLKNATTATIPSTVTRIGNGAFSQSGYKDIKISGTSNITNLEKYAFYNCQSLETVDNGFLSNVTEIPECCFYDCTSLKPISIPDNITRIGDGAFHGCTALDTVVFPENLTYIGDNSFTNCPFTTIKIPDAVTYIGKMAFTVVDATSKLESVEISDNSKLETIGDHAFQDTKITSINLPEGLKTIGEYAFSRCPITTLELPSTLTDIGRYAFMYCGKITGDVIVPAGITVLKDSVFSSCSNENLNLYIKGAITSVGKYSISYCGGKIYVYDQNTYDLINDSINNKTNYVQAEVILVKDEGPDYTVLDKAIADGEAVDTTKYTEASVKTLTDAIAAGKAVKENADATQADVDAAAKTITDAIDALVSNVRVADWTEADKWYDIAKDLLANHKDEYTEKGIADIERAISTYDSYNKPDLSQGMVDWLANLMKINIEGAEKLDSNKAFEDLKKTIEQAEAIDTSEYTEETVAKLTEALEAAKAMDENSAYDDVRAADTALKNAISGLKSLPLEPFVYIYKNGEIASIASGKTDDQMAGATQIRFTFDCADDVSYNQYASIEFKAVINGTESYQKYPGTNGYTTGATGLTETLALTNPIEAGQSFTLEGFTYSWANAADYVYAVTKVEFIDADGNVVKTIKKPEEISLDELNKAIEKAEAIDTSLYTDETVKTLTDAIAAAKKVTTTSTEEEAQAAIDAINAAIEALELKPVVTTYKVTGTVVVSDKATDTEMTLVAQAADGTKITTTATSMGEYVLEGLAAGEYTLTISGGKYVERTYEITVTDGDIAMEVNLNPFGDINGDGKVTTADVGMANSHAKGVNILEGYAFACADVNTDGTITTADVGMINSHAKDVKTLW